MPTFMAYNLGADPTLDTPKKQMAYLASAEAGGGIVTTRNGRVFGGRYQWGRNNLPYAISQDGNYTLYDATTNSVNLNTPVYDVNGQIVTNNGVDAANLHIYNSSNNGSWAQNFGTQQERDALWGNGVAVTTATNNLPGGIACNGSDYQSPVKTVNDPCPDGWRIPTQDEWERLGAYGCNSNNANGQVAVNKQITGISPNASSPFIWVPVVCGGVAGAGKCVVNATWANGVNSGYAVYKEEEWVAFTGKTGDLLATAAPEPFLFLPSAGFKNNSNPAINYVGTNGYYWSTTVDGIYAFHLMFSNLTVNPASNAYRSMGCSVRCVKE